MFNFKYFYAKMVIKNYLSTLSYRVSYTVIFIKKLFFSVPGEKLTLKFALAIHLKCRNTFLLGIRAPNFKIQLEYLIINIHTYIHTHTMTHIDESK